MGRAGRRSRRALHAAHFRGSRLCGDRWRPRATNNPLAIQSTSRGIAIPSAALIPRIDRMMLLLYVAVFIFVLLIAAGAGTLISGSRLSLALRSVLGLAAFGHLLFFLALVGWLRVVPIVIALVVAIVGGALRGFVP